MPDARFCRKCGQPSNPLGRASVTEVTTRRLETPGQPFADGQYSSGQQANLEQATHGQTEPALSTQTRNLAPVSPLKRWIPGLMLLLLAILLPTFYVLRQWRRSNVSIPPPASAPAKGPGVTQPPLPPQPPSVPPAKGATDATVIDQSFIYPGARTTMEMAKAGQGGMVQLETDDPLEKVADWYVKRLKPTETVRIPGGNVVLKSDEMKAIISNRGDKTTVLLKQGED